MVLRAVLLVLFFLPYRAATLYEVCRRRRPHLGPDNAAQRQSLPRSV